MLPQVICCPSPFSAARQDVVIGADETIRQIVETCGIPEGLWEMTHVHVQDADMARAPVAVPRPFWTWVKPRRGAMVFVRVAPMKGGRKNPLASILGLVGAAALFFLAAPLGAALFPTLGSVTIFGKTISLATALGGLLISGAFSAISSLILPPPPGPRTANPEQSDPRFGFNGQSNRADRFGPVLQVFGRHKVSPRLAAFPYTEIVSQDQYQRVLYEFGYGPLRLDDIRIGSTPLAQFEDTEFEVRQGFADDTAVTLVPEIVQEDTYELLLRGDQPPQIVATGIDPDEIGYDITFRGLTKIRTSDGSSGPRTVNIRVQYRREGEGLWIDHDVHSITGSTVEIVRFSDRIVLPQPVAPGRYELRFIRNTADSNEPTERDASFISAVRTIRRQAPVKAKERALLALRIRASNQANGILDQVTAVAYRLLPVWNAGAWTVQETRHPAWAILEVLRGRANPLPVADSQIDLQAFADWAAAEPGRTLDLVLDAASTVADTVKLLSSAARVRVLPLDGKWTVIRDVPRARVQVFTPRNSVDLRSERAFADPPHAVRAQFLNPTRDYEPDELIVYRPGYTAANATRFAEQPMTGLTDPELVFRDVRYHQAVTELRNEVFTFKTDLAHWMCTVGDRVGVQSDFLLIGLGGGRVKALTLSGGLVASVTIDASVAMAAGGSYAIGYVPAGSTVGRTATLVTVPGETQTLSLSPMLAPADAPVEGTAVAFGPAGSEVQDLIVTRVRHRRDFQAELECVPYAPAVFTAAEEPWAGYAPVIAPDPLAAVPGPVRDLALTEAIEFPAGRPASTVVAQWRPPLTGVAGLYEVWSDVASPGTQRLLGTTEAPRFVVATGLQSQHSLTVTVRARSRRGRMLPLAQAASAGISTLGDLNAPGAVTNVRMEQDGGSGAIRIRWTYSTPPTDLAGFIVRWRPGSVAVWSDGRPLTAQPAPSSLLELPGLPPGTVTIMVRAIDHAGNWSAVTATTATVAPRQGGVLLATTDYRAGGWTGTITNGVVDLDGSLLGSDAVQAFYPDGPLPFYGEPAEPFFVGFGADAFYAGSDGPFYDGLGTDPFYNGSYPALIYVDTVTLSAAGSLALRAEGTGDIALDWRPAGAGEWTPYTIPVAVQAGTFDVRATVLQGAAVRGRLTLLHAGLEVAAIIEALTGIAIAFGGSRLPLAKAFQSITSVVVTLQQDVSNSASTVQVVDRDPVLGPLVKTFDTAGGNQAGVVDAVIIGY